MRAELAVRAECLLGEGVLWSVSHREVWWTDILGKTLWRFDPLIGTARSTALPDRLACFAPLGGERILAAFATGLATYDVAGKQRQPIATLVDASPGTRLNDGRVDRQGRLVFGSMDESPKGPAPIGRLWRAEGRSPPTPLLDGIRITNSVCFSPDGRRMYFADTPSGRIEVFDYEPDGATPLSGRRTFATLSGRGLPDGSTVDADGCLWNAEWGGSRVVRYAPDGRVDRIVELPCPNVTCCAFGGPGLRTLYVTTARAGLDAASLKAAPLSGSLFAVETDVPGLEDATTVAA